MLQLIKYAYGYELVYLYVEHNISEHDIIDEAEIGHGIISDDDEVEVVNEFEVDKEVEINVEIEVDKEVEVDKKS